MKLPCPPNLAWPHVSPTAFLLLPPSNHLIDTTPYQSTELLNRLDSVLSSGSPYLVDVMLLTDDGEREEGAGICGVILWDKELERDTQRLGWGGSEAHRVKERDRPGKTVHFRSIWPSFRN